MSSHGKRARTAAALLLLNNTRARPQATAHAGSNITRGSWGLPPVMRAPLTLRSQSTSRDWKRPQASPSEAGVPAKPAAALPSAGTKRLAADATGVHGHAIDTHRDDTKSRKKARIAAGVTTATSKLDSVDAIAAVAAGPPATSVLIKVGAGGQYSTFALSFDTLRRMDRIALLFALTADDVFSVKMKDMRMRGCIVSLLPRVVGTVPTLKEEEAAVDLDGADTVDRLLVSHRWTPSELLFLRVCYSESERMAAIHIPAHADWTGLEPELPPPAVFEEVAVGDTMMIRARLRSAAGPFFPFFLSLDVFRQLRGFVEGTLADDPAMLVLLGPIKSGKSGVLRSVLPALLAEDFRARVVRNPAILHADFNCAHEPAGAASRIAYVAARLGREAGIDIDRSSSLQDAQERLPSIMGNLARQLNDRGMRLWMLLDDCQAPILAAKSHADARSFIVTMQRVVRACSPYGTRFAVTGASMTAVLNNIRTAPHSALDFQVASCLIHLGATPSSSAASAMAVDIVAAQAINGEWSDSARIHVTPERLIGQLHANVLLSRRPAMIRYVAGFVMGFQADADDTTELLSEAVESVTNNIRSDASVNLVDCLDNIRDGGDMRRVLYALATRTMASLPPRQLSLARKQQDALRMLCEPVAPNAPLVDLQLLPPYSALVTEAVNDRGNMIIQWYWQDDKFVILRSEQLRRLLLCFAVAYKSKQFSRLEQQAISNAVLDTLLAHGIGVMGPDGKLARARTASDVLKVPQFASLLRGGLDDNGKELRKHMERVKNNKYHPTGLLLLLWMHHLALHCVHCERVLRDADLPTTAVEAAARAAVSALEKLGWTSRQGLPVKPGTEPWWS